MLVVFLAGYMAASCRVFVATRSAMAMACIQIGSRPGGLSAQHSPDVHDKGVPWLVDVLPGQCSSGLYFQVQTVLL